ncbi:hypothetical protein MPER_06002, partial [Moniliophthora perniciosa FA553]
SSHAGSPTSTSPLTNLSCFAYLRAFGPAFDVSQTGLQVSAVCELSWKIAGLPYLKRDHVSTQVYVEGYVNRLLRENVFRYGRFMFPSICTSERYDLFTRFALAIFAITAMRYAALQTYAIIPVSIVGPSTFGNIDHVLVNPLHVGTLVVAGVASGVGLYLRVIDLTEEWGNLEVVNRGSTALLWIAVGLCGLSAGDFNQRMKKGTGGTESSSTYRMFKMSF